MSPPDKLTPTDPRVTHYTVLLRSKHTYHYLLATPPAGTAPAGTVLLVHGWPDLALGWRYQVPALLALNLRVIVPDMLGYGQTDAPDDVAAYSFQSVCADLAALLTHVLGADDEHAQVILGGHDWGGAVVWRFALWYPRRTQAVFSVCTPFAPPMAAYASKRHVVETVLPSFRYQLQLAGPDVEAEVVGEEKIGQFLRGMFGATTPGGERSFDTARGVVFENLGAIGRSPLLSPEEEVYYVREYARRGSLRGPLNWYRTWDVNYEEERVLVEKGAVRVAAPSMFVAARRDVALPPSMAEGMERHFDAGLVRREVDANHWALVEAAGEVNMYIEEFVSGVLKGEKGLKASI
ncbi:Alpha/Beta hydrolase protein [Podospora appendiculata]|uniref:Alpha/Beta hydrolase protein n=1 Tax=Podospora appendiculata TaxID=314037 RepID=A0AAE1CFP3_9PEZI|nr:Alpha/Beta hydrolase protein [Podospora appendiculata]